MTPTDPGPHEPVTLDTLSRHLRQALTDLGDDYGPTGVLQACYLIWPELVAIPTEPYRALDPATSNAAGKRHRSTDAAAAA